MEALLPEVPGYRHSMVEPQCTGPVRGRREFYLLPNQFRDKASCQRGDVFALLCN